MTASAANRARAAPRASATVILVRNGRDAPEFFLVRRHRETAFGDSYVFPGGLVDAQDGEVGLLSSGRIEAEIDALLDLEGGGLQYFSAAVRELFEEVGVLLAKRAGGSFADGAALEGCREPLCRGDATWPALLEREGLTIALDALYYVDFWITPREAPQRFATRFFLAELPPGAPARHREAELTDGRWLTAAAALAASDEDDLPLPRPTRAMLDILKKFATLDEVLAWAARVERAGVACRRPAIIDRDGQPAVVMPGDTGYPDYGDDDE